MPYHHRPAPGPKGPLLPLLRLGRHRLRLRRSRLLFLALFRSFFRRSDQIFSLLKRLQLPASDPGFLDRLRSADLFARLEFVVLLLGERSLRVFRVDLVDPFAGLDIFLVFSGAVFDFSGAIVSRLGSKRLQQTILRIRRLLLPQNKLQKNPLLLRGLFPLSQDLTLRQLHQRRQLWLSIDYQTSKIALLQHIENRPFRTTPIALFLEIDPLELLQQKAPLGPRESLEDLHVFPGLDSALHADLAKGEEF